MIALLISKISLRVADATLSAASTDSMHPVSKEQQPYDHMLETSLTSFATFSVSGQNREGIPLAGPFL